ncbi:MAG: Rrf2 family transcriptional regulator [Planctomycetota bacterium]
MNSELTIALHVLGFLTSRDGEPLTSEVLAHTYGTSPVVVRRVLVKLQRAGLIESRRGVGGGSVLARAPEEINLREAYDAIAADDALLPRHPGDGAPGVAPIVAGYVNELLEDAEEALMARLEDVTVAQMDRVLGGRIRRARGCSPRDARRT